MSESSRTLIQTSIKDFFTQTKESIVAKLRAFQYQPNEKLHKQMLNDIIEHVYELEHYVLKDEDDSKLSKRIKPEIPENERCNAKRADGNQCTRRRGKAAGCIFCGTHAKGAPHGVIDSSECQSCEKLEKLVLQAQDFGGIVHHIDKHGNVYNTQDVLQNVKNPKVVAKYEINAAGEYILTKNTSNKKK